jgi:hypothetical protein
MGKCLDNVHGIYKSQSTHWVDPPLVPKPNSFLVKKAHGISQVHDFPLNGVPHWMTETLASSALMKEASKCSETLQEYRSGDGKNNPGA